MTKTKHVPNVFEPFAKPYATRAERSAHAAGLRALAQWVEETSFPIPALCFAPSDWSATVEVPSSWIDDESFVKRAGSAARLIGGRVDKGTVPYGTDFKLERDFGGGVTFRYRISREAVCEAREEVVEEEHSVPVDEAEESFLRFQIEELQKELGDLDREVRLVPVTRKTYDCPESLLAPEAKAEALAEPSLEGAPF